LNPEAHLYFADRYGRLANFLESKGKKEQAEKMHDLAGYHYHSGGEKEPPPAAAAMMPVPRPRLFTSAISENDEYK